jgi:hypothetical protein
MNARLSLPGDPPTVTLPRRTLALAFATAFAAGFLVAILVVILITL